MGPRVWHSATLVNRRVYVFAGAYRVTGANGRDMLWCNDLWYFDVDQNFWAQINVDSKPKARDSHSALVLGNTILILGGWVLLMCNLCLFV